jgi:Glyoxalase-like domain
VTTTVDHLLYASPDLDQAIEHVAALLGVRAAYGGQHPGQGTHNALLSLGPRTYLEIIAPDPAQPHAARPLPFGLTDLPGPALRGWAAAPDDLDTAVERSLALGFGYGPVVPGQRRTADGRDLRWRMTAGAQHEGLAVTPFLIDWSDGAHPADSAPAGAVLTEFGLSSTDPDSLAAQLAALGLAVRVEPAARPELRAVLSGPGGQRLVLTS